MSADFQSLICFAGFVIGAVVLVLAMTSHDRRQLNELFRQLAAHHGGQFERAPRFSSVSPVVRFVYQGAHVKIDTQKTGQGMTVYTRFQISWPDRELRCEVLPQTFLHSLSKLFGTQDLQIGSRNFDRKFMIRGSSETLIRTLLNERVQHAINELRGFATGGDVYVLWSGGTLLVKVQGVLREYPRLQNFTRFAITLFEDAIATQMQGIEFLEQAMRPDTGKAICQVCGEVIQRDAVYCRSCQTPHHSDCWEYYGACSTYGCGEKEFANSKEFLRKKVRR